MSDEPIAWNVNKIAVRLPVTESFLADLPVVDFMAAFERAEDVRRNPWKAPDRNPMPAFDWWPQIDRWLAYRTEIPNRVRGAVDVLRHGVPPDRDDW